jgi:hypothetical protein
MVGWIIAWYRKFIKCRRKIKKGKVGKRKNNIMVGGVKNDK